LARTIPSAVGSSMGSPLVLEFLFLLLDVLLYLDSNGCPFMFFFFLRAALLFSISLSGHLVIVERPVVLRSFFWPRSWLACSFCLLLFFVVDPESPFYLSSHVFFPPGLSRCSLWSTYFQRRQLCGAPLMVSSCSLFYFFCFV